MANSFIKAEKVARTSLGLLKRNINLPGLVWTDGFGDFAGRKNDTLTIQLPAYLDAKTRALRSGSSRTKSSLLERSVDVKLTTDVYLDVPITDEQLTLDIADLGFQVLEPMTEGVGRVLEGILAGVITAATYENTVSYESGTDDPYDAVVVPARKALNDANVPQDGRVLVVGSSVEADILKSDRFIDPQRGGSEEAFGNGAIRRAGGFSIFPSNSIPADQAYAFHRTAFALVNRAPVVPAGAPWGATSSYAGFALRTVRVFDPDAVEDRFIMDAWVGATAVKDEGHYDADPAAGGRFVPMGETKVTGDASAWKNDTARLIRAVKVTRTEA